MQWISQTKQALKLLDAQKELFDSIEAEKRWDKIMSVRDDVLKVLEELRQSKHINSNQEASVKITVSDGQKFK